MTYFFLFRRAIVIVSLLVFSNAGAQVMFSKSQDTKVLPLWNPNTVPVYRSKADSIRLSAVEASLSDALRRGRPIKLDELILQRNELTLRKGKIRSHPYVQKLALQNNKIQQVPSSLRRFRNLKKPSFNGNAITRVHESIQQLKQLEQLSFYNNRLTAVPAGVYKLPALMEIDLFHNQIERLEPEFVNWKKLHTLYLSHNRLLELPENLHELTALVGLYLWDNAKTRELLKRKVGELRARQVFVHVSDDGEESR